MTIDIYRSLKFIELGNITTFIWWVKGGSFQNSIMHKILLKTSLKTQFQNNAAYKITSQESQFERGFRDNLVHWFTNLFWPRKPSVKNLTKKSHMWNTKAKQLWVKAAPTSRAYYLQSWLPPSPGPLFPREVKECHLELAVQSSQMRQQRSIFSFLSVKREFHI